MDDRQTGSVWTHYDGAILQGPLANTGVQLEIVPLVHTTWAEWTALHPQTTVLDWYEEFANRYREVDPGRGGLGPGFQNTILNWDNRLLENELVLGANVGAEFRAYVLADFGNALEVVNDSLSGIPLAVFIYSQSDYALAFQAVLDGQQLEMVSDGDNIYDLTTGSVWGLDGKAISGPLTGMQLEFVTSFVTEWYGWAAYHPETSIYGR